MKPKYEQPHNIEIPDFLELNEAQESHFIEVEHRRQRYEARREYKDRRGR